MFYKTLKVSLAVLIASLAGFVVSVIESYKQDGVFGYNYILPMIFGGAIFLYFITLMLKELVKNRLNREKDNEKKSR